MTGIDIEINKAFDALDVKRFPCDILQSGQINVKQAKDKLNCVVETILSTEEIEATGAIRIESVFYFFSTIKKVEALTTNYVLDELNPKLLDLAIAIVNFKKELKKCPYTVKYPRAKNPALRYKTPAVECGIELLVTFDYIPSC